MAISKLDTFYLAINLECFVSVPGLRVQYCLLGHWNSVIEG